jgi:hypothetical protein
MVKGWHIIVLLFVGLVLILTMQTRAHEPPPGSAIHTPFTSIEVHDGIAASSNISSERTAVIPPAPLPAELVSRQTGHFFRAFDAEKGDVIPNAWASTDPRSRTGDGIRGDIEGYLSLLPSSIGSPSIWYIQAPGFASTAATAASGGSSVNDARRIELQHCASLHLSLLDANNHPVSDADIVLTASIQEGLAVPVPEKEFELAFNGGSQTIRGHKSGLTGRSSHAEYEWKERTNVNGEAHFSCLPAGIAITPTVVIQRTVALEPEILTLAAGQELGVAWALPSKVTVIIELTRNDGAPLPGETLWLVRQKRDNPICLIHDMQALFDQQLNPDRSAVTDSNGVATFLSVESGEWFVGPSPQSHQSGAKTDLLAPIARRIQIAGADGIMRMELRGESGAFVAGTVVDMNGVVQPGLTVRLLSLDFCRYFTSTTEGDGQFIIGPFPSVPATLTVSKGHGHALVSMEIQPGVSDVLVRIPSLSSFFIVATDGKSGGSTQIRSVLFRGEGNCFELGAPSGRDAFECKSIPEGEYSIAARTLQGTIALIPHFVVSSETNGTTLQVQSQDVAEVQIRNASEDYIAVDAFVGTCLIAQLNIGPRHVSWVETPCCAVRFAIGASKHSQQERLVDVSPSSPTSIIWP